MVFAFMVRRGKEKCMEMQLPFEKLRVYAEALQFVDTVYAIVHTWPKTEVFGLTGQIKRASVSIILNIAEGSSRTKKDFHRFLDVARGSSYESIAILTIAKNRRFITGKQFDDLYSHCLLIIKMINGLRSSLLKP